MIALILLTALSFGLCLIMTPVCRQLALSMGLVDLPDHRKIHKRPIPRVGGVAIAFAYFGSCLLMLLLAAYSGFGSNLEFAAARSVAPAVILVFFIGLADDIFNLKPWHKLAGEIVAAALVVSAGVHIPSGSFLSVGQMLGSIGTIVWLVGCANAINLIDGVDGLAAGVALLATGSAIGAALLNGDMQLAVAAVPLAGALMAFLIFNFNPASIFLGDSGSLVLGFLLGCYGVLWSAQSSSSFAAFAPAMALAIPFIDTTVAIVRRFLRRKPIFAPDRSHIHHRLLARGLSPRRVVFVLYTAAGMAGVLSLALFRAGDAWAGGVVLGIFVCGVIAGIYQLRYAEFEVVRVLVREDVFRRELNAKLAVHNFNDGITRAETPYDCWPVIQDAAQEFGLHQVQMRLGGRTFAFQNDCSPAKSWDVRIDLSENDWIELSAGGSPTSHASATVLLVEAISAALGKKSAEFVPSPQHARLYSATAG